MTSFDKHMTHPHKLVLNSIQKQLDYVATCLRKKKITCTYSIVEH